MLLRVIEGAPIHMAPHCCLLDSSCVRYICKPAIHACIPSARSTLFLEARNSGATLSMRIAQRCPRGPLPRKESRPTPEEFAET